MSTNLQTAWPPKYKSDAQLEKLVVLLEKLVCPADTNRTLLNSKMQHQG